MSLSAENIFFVTLIKRKLHHPWISTHIFPLQFFFRLWGEVILVDTNVQTRWITVSNWHNAHSFLKGAHHRTPKDQLCDVMEIPTAAWWFSHTNKRWDAFYWKIWISMEYPMDWGMDSNPRNIVDVIVVSLEIGIIFKAFQGFPSFANKQPFKESCQPSWYFYTSTWSTCEKWVNHKFPMFSECWVNCHND